ncbi:ATP-dependent DNA helicase [Pasteurella sp. PK-2025]|uniref:ATP-dependent DNA helicase n=1 Tax=Pasteurella sp. PK-2025 TaxID=3413133 RepID=UPI003C75E7D8
MGRNWVALENLPSLINKEPSEEDVYKEHELGSGLDDNNAEVKKAFNLIKDTNQNLLITGKAGTGKTNLLMYLVSNIENKCIVNLSPTAIAAINSGGQTIHSFFKIDPNHIFTPNDPRICDNQLLGSCIKEIDTLIIDEISMVRVDLIYVIDKLLRYHRNNNETPFGGVQVVMIGDPFQLPPVLDENQKEAFKGAYDDRLYFFEAEPFTDANFEHIQLSKVYRQSDGTFIDVLNRIRDGSYNDKDISYVNEKSSCASINESVHIYPTRKGKDAYNDEQLNRIGHPEKTYTAEMHKWYEKEKPAPIELKLKVGARVMFTKNNRDYGYYNGMLGTVTELSQDGITIVTDDRKNIKPQKEEWSMYGFKYDKETKTIYRHREGWFRQYPLVLAWAITIHKSQGLTFDRVTISPERSFACGQVYVALSRCKKIENTHLINPLKSDQIIVSDKVKAFMSDENTVSPPVSHKPPEKDAYGRDPVFLQQLAISKAEPRADSSKRLAEPPRSSPKNKATPSPSRTTQKSEQDVECSSCTRIKQANLRLMVKNKALEAEVDELKRKKELASNFTPISPEQHHKIMVDYDALKKEKDELLVYIKDGCTGPKPQCLELYLNNLPPITDNEYKRTH